ncbi:SPOR domain-containing protein [Arsenicitalea aurantiaca]|nr:SPOR domain-containing protein [Arsenicitalea aurantiaca]
MPQPTHVHQVNRQERQRPRPENDSFAIPPVFGLGGKSEPALPRGEPNLDVDPMDEIESLIGEAVRVELSEPPTSPQRPQQPQAASPVVPPLNAQFAPRRSAIPEPGAGSQSAAEAAILAAAAATGAQVGRLEDAPAVAPDERPRRRSRVKPMRPRGIPRQFIGMAAAIVLLLAAGFGLYWVIGMVRDDGEAPVLTAEAGPAREPAPVAENSGDAPRSVVFDELDGVSAGADGEQLVPRDQTETATIDTPRVAAADPNETGLANRRVRTVTVRPDGTIVSGDDAVAGAQELPVARPNVPTIPGAENQTPDLLSPLSASGNTTPGSDPIADAIATADVPTDTAPITADGNLVPPAATSDQALLSGAETPTAPGANVLAPIPMPRPVNREALAAANQPTSPVNALSAQPSQPAAPAAAPSNAPAYVQLSSQRSEGEARQSLSDVQARWGGLFGGRPLEIQRANLGDRGVYYRVRLPANSIDEATRVCNSVKANGGDCFAVPG